MESYNPFKDSIEPTDDVFVEDLQIKSEEDLSTAKQMAGVIGYDDHLLRTAECSGDKKLLEYAVSNHNALEAMNLFVRDFQENFKSDKREREFLV